MSESLPAVGAMIWVQQVDILYTKASRGAPAAAARNRLPRAFPAHHSGGDSYRFEHYRLLEWADFVPALERSERASTPPGNQGNLMLEPAQGIVKLGLRWNHAIGEPPRRDQPSAISLPKGKVARLIINGRSTSYSGQIYMEVTYTVAYDDVLKPDVFVKSQVTAELDMRADLF